MMTKVVIVLCFIFLAACEKAKDQDTALSAYIPLKQLTTMGASLPNLFKDADGEIWLSYITRDDDMAKLWFAHWQDNNWSEAELIAQGDNWFINWADFPSVIKTGDTFMLTGCRIMVKVLMPMAYSMPLNRVMLPGR